MHGGNWTYLAQGQSGIMTIAKRQHSVHLLASMLLALATQGGCVPTQSVASCRVVGLEYLAGAASEAEICREFRTQLVKAMSVESRIEMIEDAAFIIEIGKRGSMTAKLADQDNQEFAGYAPVTIDVMDRPLQQRDVLLLADAVAKSLRKLR